MQKEASNTNNVANEKHQNFYDPGQTSNKSTDIKLDQSNYQHQQQPAWKALSDFALQSEIEKPPFQQLVISCSEISLSKKVFKVF